MSRRTTARARTALAVLATAGGCAAFAGPALAADGPAGHGQASIAEYGKTGVPVPPTPPLGGGGGGVAPKTESGGPTRVESATTTPTTSEASLPFTGDDVRILLAVGLALLLAGLTTRRRLAA